MNFPTDFTRKFLEQVYTKKIMEFRTRLANTTLDDDFEMIYINLGRMKRRDYLHSRLLFWEDRLNKLKDIEMLPSVA